MFRSAKRAYWKKQPLPEECQKLLSGSPLVPFWNGLDDALRYRISRDMQVLLNEKAWEGCGGLTLTDEHRWIISAHAALMMAGEISDYFPHLDSILLYPQKYVATVEEEYEGGIMSTGEEVRSGESWEGGALVLSWEEIREGGITKMDVYNDGRPVDIYNNLIFHEFAHQIDQELGITYRVESLLHSNGDDDSDRDRFPWIEAFTPHFSRFLEQVRRRRPLLFDPYGAEHPAEFFAVVTEAFFGIPKRFKTEEPELYELMKELYNLDPARFSGR